MGTRQTKHGGNYYNEEFAIPNSPKGKPDSDRIELLEKDSILNKTVV